MRTAYRGHHDRTRQSRRVARDVFERCLSVSRYDDLRKAAEDLGVGMVVPGAVQTAEATIRIDVSLVDAQTETTLWAQAYNRRITDPLAVQDDVARRVAATLAQRFESPSPRRLLRSARPTRSA